MITRPTGWDSQRRNSSLSFRSNAVRCFQPITEVIGEVNRTLKGWSQYFSHGYPRVAFRQVNWFVQSRLWRHLRRRSQRPFRPPEGVSWPAQLQRLGLRLLQPLRPPLKSTPTDSPAYAEG